MIKEMESRYSDDYVIMLIPLWEVVILYIDEGYQSDYTTIAHTCIAQGEELTILQLLLLQNICLYCTRRENMSDGGQWKPVVGMVVVNFAFAIVNVLFKKILDEGTNSMVIATYRLSTSAIFLAPVSYYWERQSFSCCTIIFSCLFSSSEHDFDVCQLVIFSVAPSLEISPSLEHGLNFFDVQRFLQGSVIQLV